MSFAGFMADVIKEAHQIFVEFWQLSINRLGLKLHLFCREKPAVLEFDEEYKKGSSPSRGWIDSLLVIASTLDTILEYLHYYS